MKSSTNADDPLTPAVPLKPGTADGLLRLLFVPPIGPPTEVPVKAGTADGLFRLEFVPTVAPTAVPVKPGTVDGELRFEFGCATVEVTPVLEPMVALGPAPVAVVVTAVEAAELATAPVFAVVVLKPTFVFGPAPVDVIAAGVAGVRVAGTVANALAAVGGTGVGLPLVATLEGPTSEAIPDGADPLTAVLMI